MADTLETTERTRLRRYHERGHFDRATIDAILDAMAMCHVGYLIKGKPVVMPTFQWREGDHVYWHASSAGRGIRNAEGTEVCLTVSILDGLVLARSGMHHSANSRSVMIFGTPRRITDEKEKLEKLKGFIDKMYPGRWDTLRPVTAQEAKATAILSLPITEASAKVRTGGILVSHRLPGTMLFQPQRVWNGHPGGGFIADGMSPSSTIRFFLTRVSAIGTADKSASV